MAKKSKAKSKSCGKTKPRKQSKAREMRRFDTATELKWPRKQTQPGVSAMAGYWLNLLSKRKKMALDSIDCRELAMVCASALGQDEVRG